MPVKTADDLLASMPDSTATSSSSPSSQYGHLLLSLPDSGPLDAPTGEGTYRMLDKSGKSLKVPYSSVRRAMQTGYSMQPEDGNKFAADLAADPSRGAKLFPELNLQEGVRVTGMNPAGQPVFGPAGTPGPKGSAAHRFASSLWDVPSEAVKGMYSALKEGPQNDEEVRAEALGGPVGLRAKRLVIDPMVAEGHKAAESFKQGDLSSAAGHGLATVIPMVGPAAAQTGEKLGTQLGTGDYAGALGTVGGNVAMEEAPRLGAKALRSKFVTRTIPHGDINRLIRPMAADLRFGKDPATAILREKIVGNNLGQLGDRVYDKLHEVGRQIDAKAQSPANAGKVVDVSVALKPLDDAMVKAVKAGDRSLYNKLRATRDELYYDWTQHTTPKGKTILRQAGRRNMSVSPYEALEFKRMIGDRIRWTQDPLEGAVNQALGDAYGKVKDSINTSVSGLKDLNERYSDLVGAAKAIERRAGIDARNAHWSLSDIVLGSTGHIPFAAARKALHHPAVRTRGSGALYNLRNVVPEPRVGVTAPAAMAAQAGRYGQQEQEPEDTVSGGAQVVTGMTAPARTPPPADSPEAPAPDAEEGAPPFAHAISGAEGFGPTLAAPTMANNPGSLKMGDVGYGTMPTAGGQQITVFGSRQEGWDALNKQLNLIFSGKSSHYSPDMTLEEFGKIYSGGDAGYGARIAASLGVEPTTTLGELAPPNQSPEAAPAPVPLQAAKAEAIQRKPSPVIRATATPQNPPHKKYWQLAKMPDGRLIGTDNGTMWFDFQTGQQER